MRLPVEHSISRLCWERDYDKENDQILSSAFEPTKRDAGRLSIDWIECSWTEQNIDTIDESISRLKKYVVKDNEVRFVCILFVENVLNLDTMNELDVVSCRTKNPCHGLIVPKSEDSLIDEDVQEELADLANKNSIFEVNN
jgi:hypothetical protein